MTPAGVDAVTWYVRHRPKDDTLAEAAVLSVDAPTPGDTIDRARAGLPSGHAITSVARY